MFANIRQVWHTKQILQPACKATTHFLFSLLFLNNHVYA